MSTTIEMFGNTFTQKVFCCKQPNGEYAAGLAWMVQGDNWNSYSSDEFPITADNGQDTKRFKGREWRQAKKYAETIK
jgi:hypothetical protein